MTYEALTLIIEHYNITMNVSPMMDHTMIHIDSDRYNDQHHNINLSHRNHVDHLLSKIHYHEQPSVMNSHSVTRNALIRLKKGVSEHFHTQVAST